MRDFPNSGKRTMKAADRAVRASTLGGAESRETMFQLGDQSSANAPQAKHASTFGMLIVRSRLQASRKMTVVWFTQKKKVERKHHRCQTCIAYQAHRPARQWAFSIPTPGSTQQPRGSQILMG